MLTGGLVEVGMGYRGSLEPPPCINKIPSRDWLTNTHGYLSETMGTWTDNYHMGNICG